MHIFKMQYISRYHSLQKDNVLQMQLFHTHDIQCSKPDHYLLKIKLFYSIILSHMQNELVAQSAFIGDTKILFCYELFVTKGKN